jgi:epoxyqueuosine reductase
VKGGFSEEVLGFVFGEDVGVLAPFDESWVRCDDFALLVTVSAVHGVEEIEAECSGYEFEALRIALRHVSSNHLFTSKMAISLYARATSNLHKAIMKVETMDKKHEEFSQGSDVEELLRNLEEAGYPGRIVSIQRLAELQEEIEKRHSQGSFDEEFYDSRLSFFEFKVPETLREARSIIILAVPRPQAQAAFTFRGERKVFVIPPTYVANQGTRARIAVLVGRILKEKGYGVALTALPLKLLAVHSGLAEYGKNNITYVPGMGSFYQLVALYSDLPCREDGWREVRMMKRCEGCQACRRACPTGAIGSDRFLLHADRCIVFHNEKKGDVPFPDWIDPSWHNCLYGCFHCQRVCPEDKHFLGWVGEKEEFSQEETELLIKGARGLSSVTLAKLKNLDLADDDSLDNLPRNLSVFFGPGKGSGVWNPIMSKEGR